MILFLLMVFVVLPLTLIVIVNSPKVQTDMVQQFIKKLSSDLNSKASVGYVEYRLLNRLILHDVYLEDLNGDTLIYIRELKARIKKIPVKSDLIHLGRVDLDRACVYLRKDSGQDINIQFLADYLKPKGTGGKMIRFEFNKIFLTNGEFRYYATNNMENSDGRINFNDLRFSNINTSLTNYIKNDSADILFKVNTLSCRERSGFLVQDFSGDLFINYKHLDIKSFRFETPTSKITGADLFFSYKSFGDWRENGYYTKVGVSLELPPANLSCSDLSFIFPVFKKLNNSFYISGLFNGTTADLKCRGLKVQYGQNTLLQSELNISGLPDLGNIFIYHDIKLFHTSLEDALSLGIANFLPADFKFPESLYSMGTIHYHGNFAGFPDDFVSYGKLSTSMGVVHTDLSFKPSLKQKNWDVRGNIKTIDFHLSKLLNSNIVEKISCNINLDGTYSSTKDFKASIDGLAQNILFNQYNYKNTKVKGVINGKKFDGLVLVHDPNCKLNFLGNFNLDKNNREFQFSASISGAKLHKLNLLKKDSATLSTYLSAHFSILDSANARGEIKLQHTKFIKASKVINLDELFLYTASINDTNQIVLKSDYLNATLKGKYHFGRLKRSYQDILYHFIPNYFPDYDTLPSYDNNFTFVADIKDVEPFCEVFLPDLSVSPGTRIRGSYCPEKDNYSIFFTTESIRYNNLQWENVALENVTSFQHLDFNLSTSRFKISDDIILNNFKINTRFSGNKADMNLRWFDNAESSSAGEILLNASINKRPGKANPEIVMEMLPTSMIFYDSLWKVHACKMIIDSNNFFIDNFRFSKRNQFVDVKGEVSENPAKKLFMEFSGFNLSNLSVFTKTSQIILEGTLDGTANLSNVYKEPRINCDFEIDSFSFNNQKLGQSTLNIAYNNASKNIQVDISTRDAGNRAIKAHGNYSTDTKNLDISGSFSKVDVGILNQYLSSNISEIKGIAEGKVRILGTLKKPKLNGYIDLKNTSFKVNYLNTSYFIEDKVLLENNSLIFDEIEFMDSEKNKGTIEGIMIFNRLNDVFMDLKISADNIMALNTSQFDNDYFYGKGYVSGIASISGRIPEVSFQISTRANDKSELFIPMSSSEQVKENNFIVFTSNKKEKKQLDDEKEEKKDNKGIKLDYELEISQNVKTQIIFDSKIGDLIRATGQGNLKMSYDNNGAFLIFGEYNIQDGDYLFTLQNIVNKRFSINNGGKIILNGNPMDADIELEAVYKIKTSLSNLFGDTTSTYRKRVPVDCMIYLTGKLMNPDIELGIKLPTADAEIQNQVDLLLNNKEKISRQFLSLLLMNNFYPDQDVAGAEFSGSKNSSVGAVTTSELLSNQLSNWLSQISNDFDVGVNYRPGDQTITDEVELALSTHLMNNRVSISGNLDMGGQQNINTDASNTSNIVGDFSVDVKIHRSGKLRVKAFNRENDDILYQNSEYTQGVGIIYREEFNRFDELMKKYWNIISGQPLEQ